MKKLTEGDHETDSPGLVAQILTFFEAVFPNLVMLGKDGVPGNLDVQKQLVGADSVTDAEARCGLNWQGKTLRIAARYDFRFVSTRSVPIAVDLLQAWLKALVVNLGRIFVFNSDVASELACQGSMRHG